jgi:hypothetical protein
MYTYIDYSDSYAPSAQTLFVKFKEIIELQFPNLPQNIIDNAVNYGTNQYTAFLNNNPTVSDQQAEDYFFEAVMANILIHNKREHDKLIAFMLAHQRHNEGSGYLTCTSPISSHILDLPSRSLKAIHKAYSDNFTPRPLRTLPTAHMRPLLYLDRVDDEAKFLSLSNTIKDKLMYIDKLAYDWDPNENRNIQLQIFNVFYNLAEHNLNANVFERALIDRVDMIIEYSSLSREVKYGFMYFFRNIIRTKDNFRYCTELIKKYRQI